MGNNKIEIPKLILDHLLQYGDTSILGLGTLFYNDRAAYFSEDKSLIFPPSTTLLFKDYIEDSDRFVDYVSARLTIKPKKAKQKIEEFAQLIINNVLNFGQAKIEGVGLLIKKDGAEITFEEEKGEVQSEFFGLAPLSIRPIQYYKTGEMDEAPMAVSTAAMPARTKSAAIGTTDIPPLQVAGIEKEDESNWLKTLLGILALLLLIVLGYKGCDYYKSHRNGNTTIEHTEGHEDGNLLDHNVTLTDTTSTAAQTIDTSPKKNTECVIIVGAYESPRNAMIMSTKISQLGYTPYEEYFDTMDVTRVGFKFDCGDKDLKEFIYSIREDISQEAWYLVPRITVE